MNDTMKVRQVQKRAKYLCEREMIVMTILNAIFNLPLIIKFLNVV